MPFPTITVAPGTGTTINTLPNAGQALAADSLPVVLTALQLAALTPLTTVGVTGAFFQTTQPVSLAAAVALAAGTNLVGKVGIDQTTPGTTNAVQLVPGATGGLTAAYLETAATTNVTVLKASPGVLYGGQFVNANAAAMYVKFYNSATAVTAGAGTPLKTICVAGGTAAQPTEVFFSQTQGVAFSAGLCVVTTANLPGTDAAAVAAGSLVQADFK